MPENEPLPEPDMPEMASANGETWGDTPFEAPSPQQGMHPDLPPIPEVPQISYGGVEVPDPPSRHDDPMDLPEIPTALGGGGDGTFPSLEGDDTSGDMVGMGSETEMNALADQITSIEQSIAMVPLRILDLVRLG
jgi:hypothetical protein